MWALFLQAIKLPWWQFLSQGFPSLSPNLLVRLRQACPQAISTDRISVDNSIEHLQRVRAACLLCRSYSTKFSVLSLTRFKLITKKISCLEHYPMVWDRQTYGECLRMSRFESLSQSRRLLCWLEPSRCEDWAFSSWECRCETWQTSVVYATCFRWAP